MTTHTNDKWVTEDDALKFSIKDGELQVEDTDSEDVIILAVDCGGLDEVIAILTSMRESMKTAESEYHERDEEDEEDEEDEVDDDDVETGEEDSEEDD